MAKYDNPLLRAVYVDTLSSDAVQAELEALQADLSAIAHTRRDAEDWAADNLIREPAPDTLQDAKIIGHSILQAESECHI